MGYGMTSTEAFIRSIIHRAPVDPPPQSQSINPMLSVKWYHSLPCSHFITRTHTWSAFWKSTKLVTYTCWTWLPQASVRTRFCLHPHRPHTTRRVKRIVRCNPNYLKFTLILHLNYITIYVHLILFLSCMGLLFSMFVLIFPLRQQEEQSL